MGTSRRRPPCSRMTHDDPFLAVFAIFSTVAAASFAAGWFGQALLGAF